MKKILIIAGALLLNAPAFAANTSLSNLSAGAAIADADLFYDVQSIGAGGVKVTGTQFWTWIGTHLVSPSPIGSTTPSTGAFTTLSATGNLTTNVTGSTQCLHVNTSGVVSGTGSDCGSGGGSGITIGTTTITSGTTTKVLFDNAGVVGEYTITGTGNVVMSASPTLTGTITASALTLSGTLTTNLTGGGTQCVHVSNTGVASGTGSDCGSGSSGITIGTTTITSGTTTRILYDNAGVVGEYTLTGSGTVVTMQTSPTLITPVLGVATATSINKVALTAPATSATITITDGKTLAVTNTLTLSGTDSTTMTFPSTNGTIATLNIADQTVTGGANVTSNNIGTVTTGTTTIDCGARPLQYFTNGGASTLAAPSNDGSCIVLMSNNGSAGAITFSGFSVGSNTGDSLTTTNTQKFSIFIWRVNSVAGYRVAAHQ